jgi:hypothetical protein
VRNKRLRRALALEIRFSRGFSFRCSPGKKEGLSFSPFSHVNLPNRATSSPDSVKPEKPVVAKGGCRIRSVENCAKCPISIRYFCEEMA